MRSPELAIWEILVSEKDTPERPFVLRTGVLLLGSSPDCAIVSTAAGVAPQHAEFFVSGERLKLRVLEGCPPVSLNGVSVLGPEEVICPATVEIGSLRILISETNAAEPSEPTANSTLRIVHPARLHPQQLTGPEDLTVTGRIVYRLPEAGDASTLPSVARSSGAPPQEAASFSEESTMAFSMESADLSLDDRVPVRMDYSVKAEIARGGMGKIYSAEDPSLKRLVALKVSTVGDREQDSKFSREAEVLAALAHPNIVPIHALGVDPVGRPFYSMKMIHGRTLQWIIKQLAAGDAATAAAYTRQRLLDIFRKVCDAVAFAHAKGFLHRDLKPENIMVGEFGEVLVMDWGLAKAIRRAGAGGGAPPALNAEPETLPYIEGTPQYMSPEQAHGVYGGLDERSDIYSLGGVLYAILTLRPPVKGASLNEVLEKVRKGETTAIALPRGADSTAARPDQPVPDALRAVTSKALARSKEMRYGSVAELSSDIDAYVSGFATRAERAGLGRQVLLLMKRNRGVSGLAFLALIGALIFTGRLAESNAESRKHAALAEEQSRLATESEQEARQDKERARQAAVRAQIALAEAAEKAINPAAMQKALADVDADLKDQPWRYLSKRADSSLPPILNTTGSPWSKFKSHPTDKDLLIIQHNDGWLRTLNLETGEFKELFKPYPEQTDFRYTRMTASSDGTSLAFVYKERKAPDVAQIRVVNLETGENLSGFELQTGGSFADEPAFLQWSKDASLLLVTYRSSNRTTSIHVLNVKTHTELWKKGPEDLKEMGLAYFARDPNRIQFHNHRNQVVDFAVHDGAELGRAPSSLKTGAFSYQDRAYSSDGNRVFTLQGNTLRLLNLANGDLAFEDRLPWGGLKGHRMSYLDEDKLLVTLSPVSDSAAALLVHNGIDGRTVRAEMVSMPQDDIRSWMLVTHPLSRRIAVVRGDSMRVWTLERPREKAGFNTSAFESVDSFSFLGHPSMMLVTAANSRNEANVCSAKIHTVDLRKPILGNESAALTFQGFSTHPNLHILSNADGTLIGTIFLRGRELAIHQWNGSTLTELRRLPVERFTKHLRLSPSGHYLWSESGVWNTDTQAPLNKTSRTGLIVTTEEILPVWLGESRVAEVNMRFKDQDQQRGSLERALVLWNAETGERGPEVPAPEANALAASPDGRRLAEAGKDMRVRLRDGETLKVLRTLRVHDGPVVDVAWHPSLPLIATSSADLSVRIWNLDTELLEEEFRSYTSDVPQRLMWSPDGKQLAVYDQSVGKPNLKIYEPKACRETVK